MQIDTHAISQELYLGHQMSICGLEIDPCEKMGLLIHMNFRYLVLNNMGCVISGVAFLYSVAGYALSLFTSGINPI